MADLPTNFDHFEFHAQGFCEDVLRFHRYRYYVLNDPVWPDHLYDAAEKKVLELYPNSRVAGTPGSSNFIDYPAYIRDGRVPNAQERADRDYLIAQYLLLF